MSDPKAELQAALKDAMVTKNNQRRDVIRMALSAIKQVEIDTRKDLTAEDVTAILQKEAKALRETIDEQTQAGRTETAAQAQRELAILTEFLPEQLSEAEIRALAEEVIAQTGANSAKDMGRVMGALMPKVKGKADGGVVNQVVRELLNKPS